MGGTTSRKVFAGISLFFAIFLVAMSTWLLVVAVNDSRCKNFDRDRYEFLRDRGFNFNQDRSRQWSFGFGRGYERDSIEGRTTEDYCINYVDAWILASGIALGIGIIQLILSATYLITAFGDPPSRTSTKIWHITWAICHILFAIGLAVTLYIGIAGDVHRYHLQTKNAGYLFCAAEGLDGVLSILLAILACVFMMRGSSKGDQRYSDGERPNSRTEFIPRPVQPVSQKKETFVS